jgi:hypothetical protein
LKRRNLMKAVCILGVGFAVALLSVASMQAQVVTGTGRPGFVPVWTGRSTISISNLQENGSNVFIGGQVSGYRFSVEGKDGIGVLANGGTGLLATSDTSFAVAGDSTSGIGVSGTSASNIGVQGSSTTNRGVEGLSTSKTGVYGASTTAVGVGGVSSGTGPNGVGVVGVGQTGVESQGNLKVFGNILATGIKAFRIDHPLDPANKYLTHAAVESSEVLNLYSGKVILDATGEALVQLPDWFEALNTDFRYQLTAMGQPGPDLYVAEEITDHRLRIAGGKPGMKVSWQVTAVRQDAWAKNHPLQVEEDKPENERGYYLDPQSYEQPPEKGLFWLHHSDLLQDANALASRDKANSD